jgi:hypothetical protein
MTRIRLKYVQEFADRKTGSVFRYFRRPGFPRVRLPGLPGSAEFMEAYQQALQLAPQPLGTKRNKAGSVAAVVAAYLDSTLHFASRAKGTQTQRRTILERFASSTAITQSGRCRRSSSPPCSPRRSPTRRATGSRRCARSVSSRSSSNTCARTPRAASSCRQ